jgi:hypothetical protein
MAVPSPLIFIPVDMPGDQINQPGAEMKRRFSGELITLILKEAEIDRRECQGRYRAS